MDALVNAKQPLVSVVMCVYNTRSYIEEAIESILQQTYKNFELVICDDGSTDGTRQWLQRFEGHPKVRLFFHEKKLGYVANKNFAIAQSKGEFITQNDSDDFSDTNRLELQVTALCRNPGIKIVACGYHKIDAVGNIFQTVQPLNDFVIEAFTGAEYPFWFPPLLVHKSVYKQIGLFTSFFAGIGDDLYWTAKANESHKIYCLRKPLYSYRNSPNSITNVLNNDRKLISTALLKELLQQRNVSGTDWLEQNNLAALKKMEKSFIEDKKFMAEQYRIWAAKAIDKRDLKQARELLKKTFIYYPWRKVNISTLFYYLRKAMPR